MNEPLPASVVRHFCDELGLVEADAPLAADFLEAWSTFCAARLWDVLKEEVGLRVRRVGVETVGCIAVLGHAQHEPGFSFYEEATAFDALWSGEPGQLDGVTVLAQEAELWPELPMPAVMRVTDSQPQAATTTELALATACLRVLLGAPQSVLELVT